MPSKNRTKKRKIHRSRKTRYKKQKGRGQGMSKPIPLNIPPPITPSDGPILPEDILFQDNDVCILKPNVKKGILIFTDYNQSKGMPSLCESGLKTGVQLQSEGVNFGRSTIHNYIFFRAPYFSNPIDYESIDTEIESSFGEGVNATPSIVWIRIDPEKTFVYSSEIRTSYSSPYHYGSLRYLSDIENEVKKSRKSMINYLKILDENEKVISTINSNQKPIFHLYSSLVYLIPIHAETPEYPLDEHNINMNSEVLVNPIHAETPEYPFDENNVNMHSEVLVRIPHLTPDYFVKCT